VQQRNRHKEEDFAEITGRVLEENADGLFNMAPDSCTVVRDVVPAGARF
jgi:hypothetical protein